MKELILSRADKTPDVYEPSLAFFNELTEVKRVLERTSRERSELRTQVVRLEEERVRLENKIANLQCMQEAYR